MKASGRILATVILMLVSAVSIAQTAGSLRLHHIEKRYNIFFPINGSKIESDYQDNSQTIETIHRDIEDTFGNDRTPFPPLDSILILATSSPDGSLAYNRELAKKRAVSTSLLLQQMFPELTPSNIKIEYIEEDWDGLRQILMADYNFPQREEMLQIIESPLSADVKEKKLRGCREGWSHFRRNHIYALRNSSITLIFPGERNELATAHKLERIEACSHKPVLEAHQPKIKRYNPSIEIPEKRKVAAIHTNLLLPFSNIGVEVCINNRWSVEGDYYFPWVFREDDHKDATQLLAWGVTARRWFGKDRRCDERLLGHSLGLGAYMGYYDFGRNYSGHQGEFASLVLDYTYAMPIFKRKMHLEFSIGAGYLYSYARPYDVFEEGGKAFREGYTKKVNWVGPLKAAVSLVVPISIKTGATK